MEAHYIPGIIVPFKIGDSVQIMEGGGSGFVGIVKPNGEISSEEMFVGCIGANNKIDEAYSYTLKITNGVMFLSFTIRDLKTGEIIAQIFDNQFYIDKTGKVNDYFTDETLFSDAHALEIKDRYGNIAFTLWIDESDKIQVRGYFYGTICTVFFNGGPMLYLYHTDSNLIVRSEEYAAKLKPRFLKR
jgi:hypothetical protein